MPIFDHSVSRSGCAAADLLQSYPSLAKLRSLSFQLLLHDDRRYWRGSVARASIVLALLGLFCGSAVVMGEKPQPSPGLAPGWPCAETQAPVRAHAKAWRVLSALSRLSGEMTLCLRSEDPSMARSIGSAVATRCSRSRAGKTKVAISWLNRTGARKWRRYGS